MTEAYKAGFEAGRTGIEWKANPYRTLSLQNIEWANGHIAGTDEAAWERHVARWTPESARRRVGGTFGT